MNWIPILIFAALVAVILMMKRSGHVSPDAALAHLKNGALVIDVRSRAEYNAGHLPGTINIPLDEVETGVSRRVPDKSQGLLLHCASGMRSGAACGKLKAIGYTNVFNLGSYGQAAAILKSAGITR